MADSSLDAKRFYVYLYRDTRPDKGLQAIYVGKGSDKERADFHWKKGSHNPFLNKVLAKIRAMGLYPLIEIVERFADEVSAFAREIELISQIGRRDLGLGSLCNLTDGGEGIIGLICTAAHRENLRRSKKAQWRNPANRERWIDASTKNLDIGRFDPVVRQRMTASLLIAKAALRNDPVRSRAQSIQRSHIRTEAWKNPTIRENYINAFGRTLPGKSEKMRNHWLNPDYRNAHEGNVVAACIAAWNDEAKREARITKIRAARLADREATSARSQARWDLTKDTRAQVKAEKARVKAAEKDERRLAKMEVALAAKAQAREEWLAGAKERRERTKIKQSASIKAYRANADPAALALHNLHVKQAKQADGEKTSAQVKAYYTSATPEQLAAHAAAISVTKTADAERIGQKSEEVWNRPGMNELISASIAVGQSAAWADPEKKAQRLAKLQATYAAKRARKAAKEALL